MIGIFYKILVVIHTYSMLFQERYPMKNPWKRLSSRKIYQNTWIRLREDRVITPSGNEGIYSVVETYPAIAVVPLTADLETYIVGQYRYALNVYSWEVPEGGGAEGEDPFEGAKRELLEETGLSAAKWTFLGNLYTSNSFTDEVGYVYLAEDLEQGTANPDSTEDLVIKKVPFREAWEMVMNEEIRDALAVISLMRVYFFLKKQRRIDF